MYQNIVKLKSGTTFIELSSIREGSFRFVEQVNGEENVRAGSAISSYIEFELYETTPSLALGDEVKYYQRTTYDKDFTELSNSYRDMPINYFIVKKVERLQKTFRYIAYDYMIKLDVDYSERLVELNEVYQSFPIEAASLVNDISGFCHVSIEDSTLSWYTPEVIHVNIPYFYSNGVTAREVLMKIAELTGQFLYVALSYPANNNPHISFGKYGLTYGSGTGMGGNWKAENNYIICPTDTVNYYQVDGDPTSQQLIPVWYKEDGLTKADYQCAQLNRAVIFKSDGSIIYDSDDDSLSPMTSGDNIYYVYGNYVVENMASEYATQTALRYCWKGGVWNALAWGITPMTVHLFPFRNPYRVGNKISYMSDADGNRFCSIVMKLEQTDYETILYCYGSEKYETREGETNKVQSLETFVNGAIEQIQGDISTLQTDVSGKVSKTGDTMTGNLSIQKDGSMLALKSTAIEHNSGTSVNNKDIGDVIQYYKGGQIASYFLSRKNTDNSMYAIVLARNYESGTDTAFDDNFIRLDVRADGRRQTKFTGQIQTSFKDSIAMGSYCVSATAMPNICEELRYSSGAAGSLKLDTAYTKDDVTIATGWYNFLWIPHRSGGVNGEASGDNCNYGSLYLSGMTVGDAAYLLRYGTNSEIKELHDLFAPRHLQNGTTRYNMDTGTNNTSDTWVPVFNGSTIQHRVIPTYCNSGGKIPVANGGTGLTASPSMLTNLASTSAADVLVASPRPGVTGTLGAGNGGTGQTSLQATRNAMGLGNTTGALPIANGGSGQTGTTSVSTVGNIITTTGASSGISLVSAEYAQWGKVAQVYITFKKSSAVSSGTIHIGTIVSGKRPKIDSFAQLGWSGATAVKGRITTGGDCQFNGAIEANTNISFKATYILA